MCLPFVEMRALQVENKRRVKRERKEADQPKIYELQNSFTDTGTLCEHRQCRVTCAECHTFLGLAAGTYRSNTNYSCPVAPSSEITRRVPRTRYEDRQGPDDLPRYMPIYRTGPRRPPTPSISSLNTSDDSGADYLPIRPLQERDVNTLRRSSSAIPRTSLSTSSRHRSSFDYDNKENIQPYERVKIRMTSPTPDRRRRHSPSDTSSLDSLEGFSRSVENPERFKQHHKRVKFASEPQLSQCSRSAYSGRPHLEREVTYTNRDKVPRKPRRSEPWDVSRTLSPEHMRRSTTRYRYPRVESVSDEDW